MRYLMVFAWTQSNERKKRFSTMLSKLFTFSCLEGSLTKRKQKKTSLKIFVSCCFSSSFEWKVVSASERFTVLFIYNRRTVFLIEISRTYLLSLEKALLL